MATKCSRRMCETVWEFVRMRVSKCGYVEYAILDNVPTYGTYPNVEMTSSSRLFNKLHCSYIPQMMSDVMLRHHFVEAGKNKVSSS